MSSNNQSSTFAIITLFYIKITASALGEALKVHGGEGVATLQDHRMIDTYLPSDAVTE